MIAAVRPKYCMLLILHWNNKLFCCIWFNLICGNSNISASSTVVVIALTCHIYRIHGTVWNFLLTKNHNPFYCPRGPLCRKYQKNIPSVIYHFKSISKTAWKKQKQIFWLIIWCNAWAVVHRYSIKQLFWKLWEKPRSKPVVKCDANKVAEFCSVIWLN